MSAQAENTSTSPLDIVKWILVIAFLAGAIIGNQYFAEQSLLIRVVAILVSSAIALLIAATTEKGKSVLGFAKEARVETRKVVWPTRQETIQTTLIIMLAVTVVSLVLWGLDGILVRVVAFILGQEV
jgi:preprotein translocase subunit SecE